MLAQQTLLKAQSLNRNHERLENITQICQKQLFLYESFQKCLETQGLLLTVINVVRDVVLAVITPITGDVQPYHILGREVSC